MSVQVFVSYSRKDGTYAAKLIADHLATRLSCRVFLDTSAIPPGAPFPLAIANEVRASSLLLLVISPHWLTTDLTIGRRPVDDPDHWIDKELLLAFESNIAVVPVLLDGVKMPAAHDLPPTIAELANRNAIELRTSAIAQDLEQVVSLVASLIDDEIKQWSDRIQPPRLLRDLIDYPFTFLKVLFIPKKFARSFHPNPDEQLVRSQAFLILSLIAYVILTAPFFVDNKGLVVRLTVQAFLLWIMVFSSSGILHKSWRWVGGTAPFSRIHSLNSYYCGVTTVLFIGIVAAAVGVLKTFEPQLLPVLVSAMKGKLGPLLHYDVGHSVALRGAFWMVVGGNLLLLFWTYLFWGAYRESSGTRRLQSAAAFAIASLLYVPVGFFFALIELGFANVLT